MNKEAVEREIQYKIGLVEEALNRFLPPDRVFPEVIHEAMRYSVFAGGKRLRPILFLAAAEAVGGRPEPLLPAAVAFELIHTYSLIHDDLPALDNDNFRRGKPTSHKVYGEAMALLAGDALLTLAFALIADCQKSGGISAETVVRVISEVAAAAGTKGMIGGQVVDILSENKTIDLELLQYIHTHKTGALFQVAVCAGAQMGGGTEEQVRALDNFACNFGLAFQITDDILDIEGDFLKLGKSVGSDVKNQKSTYPALFGLERSRELAKEAVRKALSALDVFGDGSDILRYLAVSLINREK